MGWAELVGLCIGTAAILGAGYGLGRLLRDLMRGMRRLSRMLDDWLGEPEHPGIPGTGRPGVLARLSTIEEGQRATREEMAEQGRQLALLSTRVARIEKESQTNGPPLEAGGTGFQAERAFETATAEGVRLPYGFNEQHSR